MEKNSCFPSLAINIILLFNIIIITTLTSSNSTTDQLALLAFKNTITADPHALLTHNWSTHTSLCTWIGVTCAVAHQRVTALNISHFDLEGTIPPHVGNLTFLRSLDVSFNNFSGVIPSALSNLRRLEDFNAGVNSFVGEIPSRFGDLSQLRRMNLSNNEFSGRIPNSLFNISSLQILDMGYNFLHGDIPEEVANLSSLQVLNLGFNNLTGSVPKGVFNVSSLVEIILGNNKLSNNIPSDVCSNTPRLKMISLSINQLSGEIPANIWKCRELEVLSLSANQLQGFIPEQVGNLTSLKLLDLGGNYLKGSVPPSIFNISTLRVLQLSFNQFDGNLPSVMGISLFNLEELRLSGNRFSGPIPSSIINASKLTILEINHNSFTGSIPNFGDLRLLRVLRIWGNNLTGEESISQELGFLSSLTNCRYLEVLEVSENPLNGILPAASVANLSNSLLQFSASGCNINGVIPAEIGNLSSLLELYLNENQITGYIPSTIGRLKNLQGMSLSNNQLQGHIPHDLCQMNNLAELDLSANMLMGPIPECFGKVESLRNLILGSNKLNSTIPSNFWDLNKLLTLNLSSNYLSGNLSTQIGNLKAIYRMDLSSNQFSGDIPSSFDGCQSLETLSLSDNMLTGSIPQSLGSVRGLSRLDLSNNNLSGLIPESLEKLHFLEHFNVSYNNLDGEIPNEGPFVNFSAQSFVHNSVLCGSARFHVPPCMKSHARSRPRSKDVVQLMVCIVASFMAFIIWVMGVFLSIIFVIIIRRQKDARIPPHLFDHQTSLGGAWTAISYRELVQVTSGFSETNLLGRGGIGSVYKGTLSNGLSIAVKVFNLELRGAVDSFHTETEILSSIRHRNLIRVLGCCTNIEFKALVLAYMPNGSLEKLLYSDTYYLNLVQRLNIAVDVALALEYLHHHHTFPVVHCDIKPSNVLLDQDMTAHLADFGIAKLFDEGEAQVQTTTLQGTIGYAAPEYGLEQSVSTMGDVYSYGILLLEMFTRKKPTDNMFNGEINLKEWVYDAIERNAIRKVVDPVLLSTQDQHFLPKEWLCEAIERNPTSEVVDPALLSTQDHHFLPKVLRSVFYLAMKCLTNSPYDRINMIEVAFNLQKIKYNVDSEMTRKSSPYYTFTESSPQATQTTGSQLLVS